MSYEKKQTRLLVKGLQYYNPSERVADVRLAPGWYLIVGCVGKELEAGDEVETDSGIVLVAGKEDEGRVPNTARVIACASEGCEIAKVGAYVMLPVWGGNEHDHLKAQPITRFYGDGALFYVVHEDNIPLSIPQKDSEVREDFDNRPCFGSAALYMVELDKCLTCEWMEDCWARCVSQGSRE